MTQNYLINDEEPPSRYSRLLTAIIWAAIIGVCIAFYALCGKGVIQESKPQYHQFFETAFSQSDYIPSVKYQVLASVSAYTPRPEECDDDPFINAAGQYVMSGDIACPDWLPLYSIVSINGERYICKDRMNKRYRSGNYFDIFFWDLAEAREFGRQNLIVSIH
jgi:hypothetical protein